MKFRNFTIYIFSFLLFFAANDSFSQITTDGLVGYYKLDGNTIDSSPIGNDGIIQLSPSGSVVPTANRFGEAGKAMMFNEGAISLGNLAELQFTDSISVAGWINTIQVNGWAGIFSKWDNTNNSGLFLGLNPSGNVIRWNLTNMPDPVEGTSLVLGEWTHIVATFDGEKAALYYNGELVDMIEHAVPIPQNDSNFSIGSQNNTLSTHMGAMDNVLIYNRALTQEEVTLIFNDDGVSSTKDNVYESVDLFPNPTNGNLNIDNKSNSKIISYVLSDATGKHIQSGAYQNELDLSGQPSGVYYISLRFEDGTATKKLIKL